MKADPAADRPTRQPRPPAPPSKPGLEVLQQLRVIVRLAGAHSALAERSTGIPGAQLWALHEVAATDGLKVGELAQRLRVHQATISNLLLRLEAKGLVRKVRSASDQRIVHVKATPAGKKVLRSAPLPTRGLLPHALDSLPPTQLRQVQRGLKVLLDALGGFDAALAERPLPFTE
jgi:DNA-binding MarR family transcriptional regulator